MNERPVILWLRRDLRLHDHPAMQAAVRTGRPVIPVFICDETVEGLGAAPKWRLGQALEAFSASLNAIGSRLVLRKGAALEVLRALIAETGAGSVFWSRYYDGPARDRDSTVKAALKAEGVEAESFAGFLLFEPWTVETRQGGPYRVYTPFWRAVRDVPVAAPEAAVTALPAPDCWPEGDNLAAWRLGAAMHRGADVVARYARVGEAAALDRLQQFCEDKIEAYAEARDFPARAATSGLSENLTYGEISPRLIWHAGWRSVHEGARGAEHFLKELVWREFAWHLLYHFPDLGQANWRAEWDGFPWRGDSADAESWRRGMTGEPLVDAAMRELYITGTMHNRARMIAASYLTKHLLTDWRIGRAWFEETLIDWDPAANAMGWQWVAGCGPDAAPYFRVFNPSGQADKFDRDGGYRRRFIAEGQTDPARSALDFFAAAPRNWALSAAHPYPSAQVELAEGRLRALAAYEALRAKAL
ncbi:deoxyribodipyrimidine photo-lyase [Thioclava sp. A2]|uniref:cryptochrome/photolyase family protein n=1 Tax=Thioclava sp. FCG-A2 TaxID=3080562 RepID=UPI002952AA07|nr:deoxyribodipyrimidine photo-lyase [Thioclava sp. A2]MDV7271951.1 deoxyribodipyrimidine photo-lyase [Thioclava sp. A2]